MVHLYDPQVKLLPQQLINVVFELDKARDNTKKNSETCTCAILI